MTTETPTTYELRTWDFSYQRHTKRFRFRNGETEVLTASMEGPTFIEGADGSTGHMLVRCAMTVDAAGNARLSYEGTRYVAVPLDTEYAQWWQLCFARKESKWRVWDRDNRGPTMKYVDGYYGPAYISWHDKGGHVFVHGRRWNAESPGGVIACFAGDVPA